MTKKYSVNNALDVCAGLTEYSAKIVPLTSKIFEENRFYLSLLFECDDGLSDAVNIHGQKNIESFFSAANARVEFQFVGKVISVYRNKHDLTEKVGINNNMFDVSYI